MTEKIGFLFKQSIFQIQIEEFGKSRNLFYHYQICYLQHKRTHISSFWYVNLPMNLLSK